MVSRLQAEPSGDAAAGERGTGGAAAEVGWFSAGRVIDSAAASADRGLGPDRGSQAAATEVISDEEGV